MTLNMSREDTTDVEMTVDVSVESCTVLKFIPEVESKIKQHMQSVVTFNIHHDISVFH